MADLVASDVSYEILSKDIEDGSGDRVIRAKLTTAAGDYPTGGIPISKAMLGCPSHIKSFLVIEPNAAGADVYKYDYSAEKLKVFQESAGTYAEHANAAFTSPNELVVEVKGY